MQHLVLGLQMIEADLDEPDVQLVSCSSCLVHTCREEADPPDLRLD